MSANSDNDFDQDDPPPRKVSPLFTTSIKWSIAAVLAAVLVVGIVVIVKISRNASQESSQRECYAKWFAIEQDVNRLGGQVNKLEGAISESNFKEQKAKETLGAIKQTKHFAVIKAEESVKNASQEVDKSVKAITAAESAKNHATEALNNSKANKLLEKATKAVELAVKDLELAKGKEASSIKEADKGVAEIEAMEAAKVKKADDSLSSAIIRREAAREEVEKKLGSVAALEAAKAEVIAAKKEKASAEEEAMKAVAQAKNAIEAKLTIPAMKVATAAKSLETAKATHQTEIAKATEQADAEKELKKAKEKLKAARKGKEQAEQELLDTKKPSISTEELNAEKERDSANAQMGAKKKEISDLMLEIQEYKSNQADLDAQSHKEWGVSAQALKEKMDADQREAAQTSQMESAATREHIARYSMLGIMALIAALVIGYFVGVILLMAWVARDCRARGVDGGAVWVFMMLLGHWIALIIYLASRPYGKLIPCSRCNNKRLMAAIQCPHCGVRSFKKARNRTVAFQ